MSSEKRTISDPAPPYLNTSFTLSYAYNLAGELKALTDPWNVTINYGFDFSGRLTNVTAVNYGVSQLVNSIAYRAWGAPRQIAYGNGRTALTSYDARLQTSHFEIPSAGGLPGVMSIDYQYYADGRIRYSNSLLDPRFDRSYEYDHATRIVTARSGAEARGEPATTDRPYKESFAYDVFNHFTSRETESWSKSHGFWSNDSYNNNRRIGWTYDSQGNLTNNLKRQYTYDAAAQMIVISSSSGSFNQVFDGLGNRIKTTEFGIATYYLRSTVVGQVVNELASSGVSQRSFVYAGGKVLAESGLIVHDEVSGTSVRKTSAQSGHTILFAELDPLGADAYTEDPYFADPQFGGRGEGGPVYPGYGNISDPSRGCTADGIYGVCEPDISFWGSSIASLPGFGTNWGSFSQLAQWEYKQRLAYTLAQLNGIQRWREGAPRGSDMLRQEPITNNPTTIDNSGSPDQACAIKVSFSGQYDGLPNGPSAPRANGVPAYGIGFSVSVSGLSGNVAMRSSEQDPKPKGTWLVEQWVADYNFRDGQVVRQDTKAQMDNLGRAVPRPRRDGDTVSWWDHPGDRTPGMKGYFTKRNFYVKAYNGAQHCEIAFHLTFRVFNGMITNAEWGPGNYNR